MMAQSDISAARLHGLRILLVEDEAMVAMLVECMLGDLGCQIVEWAASIPAALNAIDTHEIDGALLDVNLGGMMVFPVAERLLAKRVPFVFASGYGLTVEIGMRFSGTAVLRKPFDSSQLAQVLADEFASSRAAKARRD